MEDLQTQHQQKGITDFEYDVKWGKLRDEMEDIVLHESNENYADGQSYSNVLQPKSEVKLLLNVKCPPPHCSFCTFAANWG